MYPSDKSVCVSGVRGWMGWFGLLRNLGVPGPRHASQHCASVFNTPWGVVKAKLAYVTKHIHQYVRCTKTK